MSHSDLVAAYLPPRPQLCLRVGLAGNRTIDPSKVSAITDRLVDIWAAAAERLTSATVNPDNRVTRFYNDQQRPLLRLVMGLAEGADTLGAEALEHFAGVAPATIDTELAAVIPFDVHPYRESRDAGFLPSFDRFASRCTYILALDGIYQKPSPDTPLARLRRGRAYRAQAAVLLRHVDLMVIVADPSGKGQAGGAIETLHAALAFGLAVVFIDAVTARVQVIEPQANAQQVLEAGMADAENATEWQARFAGVVDQIIASPDVQVAISQGSATATKRDHALLEEYFANSAMPPMEKNSSGQLVRKPSLRERIWSWFEGRLRRAGPVTTKPKSDPKLPAYAPWRNRATDLNYDAAAQYRGAFLSNYLLAVVAVALAAVSLALIGYKHGSPYAGQISWGLTILALLKLGVLIAIFRNTHQAARANWNDRAIDYRYLAERLRALHYLPRTGSFQPPYVAPPEYASRVLRQSVVDWLADAITRAVSAAQVLPVLVESVNVVEGKSYPVRLIRLDPMATARRLRADWVGQQIAYHDGVVKVMKHLHTLLERWGNRLSGAVIAIVALDICLLIWEHLAPHSWPHLAHVIERPLHHLGVIFLLCAAVLPAAVASLNGIRFQSECRRLHERSAMMRDRLQGRANELDKFITKIASAVDNPDTNPGAWTADLMHLAETIARDLITEVGEWSVLYTREVPDPG
jgi:hypothetical protein